MDKLWIEANLAKFFLLLFEELPFLKKIFALLLQINKTKWFQTYLPSHPLKEFSYQDIATDILRLDYSHDGPRMNDDYNLHYTFQILDLWKA